MDKKFIALQRELENKTIERKLAVKPSSIDEGTRSIKFVLISKDNAGKRFDWERGVYIEELDVNGANYERLRTFFKDHDRSVDSAIGGWNDVGVESGELVGRVVFGTDEESEKVFRKYVDKVLTDCSVTYIRNKVLIEEREGEPDLVTVIDYEILECSAVGVGFDKGAKVRNKNKNGEDSMNEKLQKELEVLRKAVDTLNDSEKARMKVLSDLEDTEKNRTIDTSKVQEASAAGIQIERERTTSISDLVVGGQITSERANAFLKDGTSIEQVRKLVLDEKIVGSAPVNHSRSATKTEMIRGIENSILIRCGVSISSENEETESFRGASLLDMARALTNYQGYDNLDLAKRAMSSSDFSMLLGNVANRILASGFEEEEGTFSLWTQAVELPDFRIRNEISLKSQGGRLQKVKEKSEKKKIEFSEDGTGWALESYGAEFTLTREMIINDDLGVFEGIVAEFGKMAKRTSNGLVYDLLQNKGDFSDYKMSDGKVIFHTSHNNLASTGAKLGSETLSAARVLMRRQKDGDKQLNIVPKYLLVASEEERIALQLLTSEAEVGSSNSGITNPHKNNSTLIVENELSANAWYLAAKSNTIKVGYLVGTNKQPIVEQKRSDIDGIEFKCVFDFGVVVTDYKGLYKNAGV